MKLRNEADCDVEIKQQEPQEQLQVIMQYHLQVKMQVELQNWREDKYGN